MTDTTAVRRLKKILGPKAWADKYRGVIYTDAERPEVEASMRQDAAAAKAAREARDARAAAVLAADAEYQRLVVEARALGDRSKEHLSDPKLRHRYVVGVDRGFAREIKASANSWERVFELLANGNAPDRR